MLLIFFSDREQSMSCVKAKFSQRSAINSNVIDNMNYQKFYLIFKQHQAPSPESRNELLTFVVLKWVYLCLAFARLNRWRCLITYPNTYFHLIIPLRFSYAINETIKYPNKMSIRISTQILRENRSTDLKWIYLKCSHRLCIIKSKIHRCYFQFLTFIP